jgi:ferritin-like metal-binding protein YciE
VAAWAEGLGYTDAAELLRETLDEEKTADETLTGLAEAGINAAAGGSAPVPGKARTAGRI